MGRYISVPTEIEAVQWTGENFTECYIFCGERNVETPENPYMVPVFNRIGTYLSAESDEKGFMSATAEIWVAANESVLPLETGEWIIKDSLGVYPCKDEIFRAKYKEI